MKLLFGSSESPSFCTSATCSDYSYRAWKGEGHIWHEELQVFGKPILDPGSGFRRVTGTTRLITLNDQDVHIWNYLEITPMQNFASAMRSFFMTIVFIVVSFIFSQILAFIVGEFGYMSLAWYFRYPIFGTVSIFIVFIGAFTYDELTYEYKLRKVSRLVRELSKITDQEESYYKEVLEKISVCNDKERSKVARKLLSRRLV